MNFGELKSSVALCLGNLRDSDPFYLRLPWAINSAIREVPKRVLAVKGDYNQFFELRTHWRDTTVATQHEYGLPADCLIAYALYSLDDDGTFLGEGVGSSRPVDYADYEQYELLPRDSAGLPRNWTMGGSSIKIWPTPDADNITTFRIFGLELEAPLVDDLSVPSLRDHWHNAVVFYAAYLLSGLKGWKERSAFFYQMFSEAISLSIDPTAVLLSHKQGSIDIVGDPTRG